MSFTFSWSLVKLMSIESVIPSNHLIDFLEDIYSTNICMPESYIFTNKTVFLHIHLSNPSSFSYFLFAIFLSIYLSFVYSVQFSRSVPPFVTPCTAAHQTSLSITNSQSLPKLMSIESVMPSNHFILCRPLLLPSIFLSIRVFSNESFLCIRWPASTSVLPMNTQDWSLLGWTGWISLQPKRLSRVFSNTTVQKHSILWFSAFFIVQLSYPYMTTGKTIALTRWTFVGKIMSLLFNMLSMLVLTFLQGVSIF